MIDVVCVGAHPDDVEIGMGATVAGMVRQGMTVAIVDLTNGEPTPHGTPETRAGESAEAARILGVERRTLGMPNRYLFDSIENRTELAEVLRELRPRLLFAPYPTDAHPDHIAASAIAVGARFYAKFTKTDMAGEPHYPARLYHYIAVHLALQVKPSFVVAATDQDVAAKLDSLRAYRSQFEANERNASIIATMELRARYWGGLVNAPAGEPFFSAEEIGVRSVGDLV
ncbi:MAG: bacillithiol biosynthesis deacetylase BshB1 [Actinomycetota bacterium]|nr:bacillithiol biosynthesis deacetylase BshB1 [Actinomycetota bacterium]MDP3630951.1 bacillithiol biosynthesis deacetylase BshB1 [Actinomycetota bacterium]